MNENREDQDSFDEFVKRQQQEPVDWAKQREEWLEKLDVLYRMIEQSLNKYIDAGEIKCEYSNIELNEEDIGTYTARKMRITIGRRVVTLTPVGTMLIGAKGRVDVVGPAGQTRFMLLNSKASRPSDMISVRVSVGKPPPSSPPSKPQEITWVWKIATNPPIVQFIELTKETLFQALMEVANG
jgi:hypothetical protein